MTDFVPRGLRRRGVFTQCPQPGDVVHSQTEQADRSDLDRGSTGNSGVDETTRGSRHAIPLLIETDTPRSRHIKSVSIMRVPPVHS